MIRYGEYIKLGKSTGRTITAIAWLLKDEARIMICTDPWQKKAILERIEFLGRGYNFDPDRIIVVYDV